MYSDMDVLNENIAIMAYDVYPGCMTACFVLLMLGPG